MPKLETRGWGRGEEQMGSQILTGIGGEGEERRNFCCFNEFRIMNGFSSTKISTNLRCRPETQNQ